MQSHPLDRNIAEHGVLQFPDPGASTEATITTPAKRIIQLNAISFIFTASAVGANRYISIQFRRLAGEPFWFTQAPFALTASTSMKFSYGIAAAPVNFSATQSRFSGPLPAGVRLTDIDDIHINVENIAAGDTLTNIFYQFDRWYDIGRLA